MKGSNIHQGVMGDLSPHTLAVLTLLQEYCRGLVVLEQPADAEESRCDEEWPPATRHAIALLLVREIQAGSNDTYTRTLRPLHEDITAIEDDGPEIASLLRETLLQIESPEEVFRLTDALRALISPSASGDAPALEPNSLFGVFVRRSLLQFFQMDFFQVSRLYRRMTQVYNRLGSVDGCDDVTERRSADPVREWSPLSPQPRPRSADVGHAPTPSSLRHQSRHPRRCRRDRIPPPANTASIAAAGSPGHPLSRMPSALLRLEQEATTGVIPTHEAGRLLKEVDGMLVEGCSADEIKQGLHYPVERIAHLPVVHYVRYACCMQSGDASGALANMHGYFDLQAKHSAWISPADNAVPAVGDAGGPRVKKPPVHYAALSLAATHYRFGDIPEATQAVLEAIQFAQNSADDVFLQHALGWLALLHSDTTLKPNPASNAFATPVVTLGGSHHGNTTPASAVGKPVGDVSVHKVDSAGDLTRHFVAATRHHEDPEGIYLQGLAKLAHAKQQFSTGCAPSEVLTLVRDGYSASVLNATQSSPLAASFDTLMGMCFLLHAALFDAYGCVPLLLLYAQLHLRNRAPGAPEDGCDAYCKLALHCVAQGHREIADRLLAEVQYLFPKGTPTARIWELTQENIDFQQALLQGNLETAQSIARRIKGSSEELASNGVDNAYRQALIAIECGDHCTAITHLHRVLTRLKPAFTALSAASVARGTKHASNGATNAAGQHNSGENSAVPMVNCKYVHVLTVLADCHLTMDDASRALVVARDAQAHARTHRLASLHASATRLCAGALAALGRPHDALRTLDGVYPQLLGHGSCEERGRTRYTRGIIRLSLLTPGNFYPPARAQGLAAGIFSPKSAAPVVQALQRAVEDFATIGAGRLCRDALLVLAAVHHAVGDTGARDTIAARLLDSSAL
eukprot:m.918316 g.918316  ORF g.918316 m.918316 type:complete len:915 (-) comp23744_c1_seq1:4234-6978(-)